MFLDYYSRFCSRIFVHDNESSDNTARIACAHSRTEVLKFNTAGELRDDVHAQIKGRQWRDRGADWVITVDCDEFIAGPMGMPVNELIDQYDASSIDVVTAQGWHVCGERLPNGSTLVEECKTGIRDHEYDKPICFRGTLGELNFIPGAHGAAPVDLEGRAVAVTEGPNPPLYLLHLKFCRPLEDLLERHRQVAARRSRLNREGCWGWEYEDPEFTAALYRQVREAAVRLPTARG